MENRKQKKKKFSYLIQFARKIFPALDTDRKTKQNVGGIFGVIKVRN